MAVYDVTQIDVLEHDTTNGEHNSIVMIDSTHFMLAYCGTLDDGYIKTFSIDGNYDNITQIDSLEYDTSYGRYNSLVMIDSTHFILGYMGSGADGFIKTFSIDGNYDNITLIDSIEHDITNGTYNSIVKIDATHFMLAYCGSGSDGFIKTFSIDGNYDNITQIDSLEHDTSSGKHNSIVMIDSTHFMLAYCGTLDDGYIKTFSIDGNYDNITQIDSLEYDTIDGRYNSLVMIDSTHFILAHFRTGAGEFIKTFSIDGNYDNITQIDSIRQDTFLSDTYNSIVKIDATHFMLAYTGDGDDGYIKTFSIDGNYDNITQRSSLEQDNIHGTYNSIVKIDATHFMLAYTGDGDDGYIKTFVYEPPALGVAPTSVIYGPLVGPLGGPI